MAITPDEFAASAQSYVEAPAGYGKTELIADSLLHLDDSRQLLLTHTHAGVKALRERLAAKGIPPSQHRIETIAGFALHWARGYPQTSGFEEIYPSADEWRQIYPAAERVLRVDSLMGVVASSYDGVIVDEYQDCSQSQHRLIARVAEALPARVVGDPLQGILGFDEDDPLVSEGEITEVFKPIDTLDTPHRWQTTNPELGDWLIEARTRLVEGGDLDLTNAPVDIREAEIPAAVVRLKQLMSADGSVVALRAQPAQAHDLAKRTGALYTSMETVGCQDLLDEASKIQGSSGPGRSAAVIDFVQKCVANTGGFINDLKTTYSSGELAAPKGGKRGEVKSALNKVAEESGLERVWSAVESLREYADRKPFRAELFWEMKRALDRSIDLGVPLEEAAWHVRDRTRRIGRPPWRRLVSRTALVKGLEFDHVAVLDLHQLDVRNTYVAITRGSKSLTVFA